MDRELFVLGASGFIGREVVRLAASSGWRVKALVRSDEAATVVDRLGARAIRGDAGEPERWADETRGAVLVDLVQPALPRRVGHREITRVSRVRQDTTARWLAAIGRLPVSERPRLVSVSGVDDLDPDDAGRLSHRSALRSRAAGFAHIGLPVRRLVEASALDATFAYLGTVYGPGKSFAEVVLPGLAARKQPVVGRGDNRLAIVHVSDAAAALVHVAGLASKGTYVVADGADTTQRSFLEHAARLLGAPPPRQVPRWLGALVAGSVLVDVLTRDAPADPSALLGTGFRFRYPTHLEGMAETVRALGMRAAPRAS